MIESKEPKRFEDWVRNVDCNNCAKYWDSSCDGVKCDTNSDKALQGSRRLCNSYLPTRSVVIPAQIQDLQWRTERLRKHLLILYGTNIIMLIAYIMGWL